MCIKKAKKNYRTEPCFHSLLRLFTLAGLPYARFKRYGKQEPVLWILFTFIYYCIFIKFFCIIMQILNKKGVVL